MFQLLFLLLVCCNYGTATVILGSSVGMRQVCPGEMVTYTCTVTQGLALDWIVEPFINGSTPLRFLRMTPTGSSQYCNGTTAANCSGFDFVAILTDVNPDITSTLTFTTTVRLNGTVVQCRGATADGFPITNSTLNIAGLPFPPWTPFYTVQQYGQDNVTLTVQWQPPQYDGGAPVNYTITASPGLSPVTTSGTSVPVTVPYNVNHTVSIVATNCIGSSSAVMETIPAIVNCSDPTSPVDGSIVPYQNTTEGAEIFFKCNAMFVPSEKMTAVCGTDQRWDPDPADLTCTFDCDPPVAPRNGSLESYTNTTEGSEVFYSCDQGLVPQGMMRANCTTNGWSPNPADLSCSKVDCGVPPQPANGSLQLCTSTTAGSEVVFWCNPGLIPERVMTAVCGRDGQWSPNPGNITCSPRSVDCGMPTTPENGIIENIQSISTVRGAQIFFRCNPRYVPARRMSATCMLLDRMSVDGNWTPDPADLVCIASEVDCGGPTPANGVTVLQPHTTTVSSVIVYQCQQPGFAPSNSSSVCGENGRWRPDPSRVTCLEVPTTPTPPPTTGGLSGGAIAGIIIVLLLVAALAIAVVIFVFIWWRRRSDVPPKLPPQSDDVGMYSMVESPEKPAPYTGYMHQGPGTEAEYTTVPDVPGAQSKAGEVHYDLPPGSNHPEGLVYASVDIKPKKPSAHRPKPVEQDDRVEYAAITFQPKDAAINSQAAAATAPKTKKRYENADELVNLDNLLIQLRDITPMWFDLGDALDLPPSILDDIRGQFEANPMQCMIEVVDAWLHRHLSRGSPTWTEVAEALRKINQTGLADALESVYYTGELPISVNMTEIPESVFQEGGGTPPPIPVRGTLTDDVEPAPPKPPKSWGTPEKKAPPQHPPRGGSGRRPPPRPPKPSAP